jgi:prevent-host-death family protein
MKTISAANFKAKCLSLMDKVQSSKETLVVTKHGKPVVKIVPYREDEGENPLKDSVVFEKDLVSPLEVTWESSQ